MLGVSASDVRLLNRQTAKRAGPLPKVTQEAVERVATNMGQGIPLRYALALESPVIPLNHWTSCLQASPVLSAIFDKKVAERIKEVMGIILGAECLRKMPPHVWMLERIFPGEFGQQKAPSHVTNNLTLIGVSNDIAQRAAELVRRKTPEELALASGRAENIKRIRQRRIKQSPQPVVDTPDSANVIDVSASVTRQEDTHK